MNIIDVARGSYKEVIPAIEGPVFHIRDIPTEEINMDAGWLLTDFSHRLLEKSAIIQCFNGFNHVYAFGHDPENSTFSFTYTVFLGEACIKREKGFTASNTFDTEFFQKYLDKRVSKSESTVDIIFSTSQTLTGILLAFDVSVADAEMHALSVTFSGRLTEVE